jgi:hypothetical protein
VEKRNSYVALVRDYLKRHTSRFDDNIKICPKEAGWKVVGWIDLSRYKKKRG